MPAHGKLSHIFENCQKPGGWPGGGGGREVCLDLTDIVVHDSQGGGSMLGFD